MNQEWFEMKNLRRKVYGNSAWVSLLEHSYLEKNGKSGYEGYKEEFFGVCSVFIPKDKFNKALDLKLSQNGVYNETRAYADKRYYHQSDVFKNEYVGVTGVYPVLIQRFDGDFNDVWHVHQDIIIALGLLREGDVWVAPNEGFAEVIKLERDPNDKPISLKIKNDFLKDYLCARNMGLVLSTFRERRAVLETRTDLDWREDTLRETEAGLRWDGCVREIHEGGMPYGESTAVYHLSRTDIDLDEDVPVMGIPNNENLELKHWTEKSEGKKLYYLAGSLWKDELIMPKEFSERIRRDACPTPPSFYVDASGNMANCNILIDQGRWLWFNPSVINEILKKRSSSLKFYTKDTGSVACSPGYGINFGINPLGKIVVYAKDIAILPTWQQLIWAGFTQLPEGGISEELYRSQIEADPAPTFAPETFLERVYGEINELFNEKYGFPLFNDHKEIINIIQGIHRFRSLDNEGFYDLAKDIARITADAINRDKLKSHMGLPSKDKLGSLKSLELFIIQECGLSDDDGRTLMSPFFGIYDLRLSSAHLPSSELTQAYLNARVNENDLPLFRGYQLLHSFVSTMCDIGRLVEGTNNGPPTHNNDKN